MCSRLATPSFLNTVENLVSGLPLYELLMFVMGILLSKMLFFPNVLRKNNFYIAILLFH